MQSLNNNMIRNLTNSSEISKISPVAIKNYNNI